MFKLNPEMLKRVNDCKVNISNLELAISVTCNNGEKAIYRKNISTEQEEIDAIYTTVKETKAIYDSIIAQNNKVFNV